MIGNGGTAPDLYVGPRDDGNRRLVTVSLAGVEVDRDIIDTDVAFARENLCKRVIARCRTQLQALGVKANRNFGQDLDREIRKRADAADSNEQAKQGVVSGRIEFERLTSAELADLECRVRWLVKDMIPEAQGGIESGRFKTLKTAVAADVVISVATGTPCLGSFDVPEARRVGIMSAEVGWPSLKERAISVAAARGIDLRDIDNAVWSTSCPKLDRSEHCEALERFIVEDELALLFVDPTYLAMSGAGDSVANLFKMGALLSPLTQIIERTGCSIVLINHNRKGRSSKVEYEPPDLSEISMAGFAEWARFWMLLGPRREWDEERGQHWLWLRTGGSAGHGGLVHLDVFEGKRSDPGGRQWSVDVQPAEAGRKIEQERQQAAAQAKRSDQVEADKRDILSTLAKFPAGETKSNIRDFSGIRTGRFNAAIAELLSTGEVVHAEILKGNNRSYPGIKFGRSS